MIPAAIPKRKPVIKSGMVAQVGHSFLMVITSILFDGLFFIFFIQDGAI